MSRVKATALEREDLIRWIIGAPTYRVDFWDWISPGDGTQGTGHWRQESYYVTEADTDEVIAWASSKAEGRQLVIYLRATRDGEPGLIRLLGTDPLDNLAR